MYLVTRPLIEAVELCQLLSNGGIKSAHLPLMDIVGCESFTAEDLKIASNASAIFITSPVTVRYAESIIRLLNDTSKIIAAGEVSAVKVLEINPKLNVVSCPISGVTEIIASGILDDVTDIAIIGGNSPNDKLVEYCVMHGIKYNFICAYQRIDLLSSHESIIEKLILDSYVDGIVVTSTHLARLIIQLMCRNDLIAQKLRTILFISIHRNITQILHDNGLTVKTALSSSNASIVKLILELEDEQKSTR